MTGLTVHVIINTTASEFQVCRQGRRPGNTPPLEHRQEPTHTNRGEREKGKMVGVREVDSRYRVG